MRPARSAWPAPFTWTCSTTASAWSPTRQAAGWSWRDEGGSLELTAELPPIPAADRALDDIRTGRANGLSVEFRALKVSRVDGVRVIEDAVLEGVGIVRAPSYQGSRVEARDRRRRTWL